MGNYHDDVRSAAQEVVDAREELKNLLRISLRTEAQERTALSNLYVKVDWLKRTLDLYDA